MSFNIAVDTQLDDLKKNVQVSFDPGDALKLEREIIRILANRQEKNKSVYGKVNKKYAKIKSEIRADYSGRDVDLRFGFRWVKGRGWVKSPNNMLDSMKGFRKGNQLIIRFPDRFAREKANYTDDKYDWFGLTDAEFEQALRVL